MRTWSNVAIVGVGLIGGSIGLALKQRGLAEHVTGIGRRRSSLQKALARGAVDSTTTSINRGVQRAELVVVCTPVNHVVEHVSEVAEHAPVGALIADAASTKGRIVRELSKLLPAERRFLGSHPLAGSEKSGPEFADPQLFENRLVLTTPTDATAPATVRAIGRFWRSLGANVQSLSPDQHDQILARTSHLPHVVATALIRSMDTTDLPFSAGGLDDSTRISGGDADLWARILLENSDHLLDAITHFESRLTQLRNALESGNDSKLRTLLKEGQQLRTALVKKQSRKK